MRAFRVGVLLWASLLSGVMGTAVAAQEIKPMAPAADPAYEVATIKPSDPSNGSSGFQLRDREVIVLNETVASMLLFAYGIQRGQIVGGPAWIDSDHYDVVGFANVEGQPSVRQFRGMVRKILADRFGLRVREDQRTMPVYALRQAKGGPKLVKAAGGMGEQPDQTGNGDAATSEFRFTNNTMADFAGFLQFEMDRPVLDETALPGRFDFKLKWARDAARPAETADAPPSMFTAVQEQLGLKLEPVRDPAKVLVVEGLERPSAN